MRPGKANSPSSMPQRRDMQCMVYRKHLQRFPELLPARGARARHALEPPEAHRDLAPVWDSRSHEIPRRQAETAVFPGGSRLPVCRNGSSSASPMCGRKGLQSVPPLSPVNVANVEMLPMWKCCQYPIPMTNWQLATFSHWQHSRSDMKTGPRN